MATGVSILLSTASLVTVRSAGVGARSLGLLTLAAAMPADRFATYATAFVLSELARCCTDFGVDPVVLRRAEGLGGEEQRAMIRAALAVRACHGAAAAAVVILLLTLLFPLDLLLIAAGLQFLPQGLLQLSLNWRQVNNSAHRVAAPLLLFYCAVAGMATLAWAHPPIARFPLPLILCGELGTALILLSPLAGLSLADLRRGYRIIVPQALPMAGVMFLAFVNTRTDALLVGHLLDASSAGAYLYLARWVDFAPMLAMGVALPMVGKVNGYAPLRYRSLLIGLGLAMVLTPFILVEGAAVLRPSYASEPALRFLLATVAVLRTGLAITTTALLARWHDRLLMRVACATTALVPALCWLLGSRFGATGLVVGVLVAEAGNLLFQSAILLSRRGLPSDGSLRKLR